MDRGKGNASGASEETGVKQHGWPGKETLASRVYGPLTADSRVKSGQTIPEATGLSAQHRIPLKSASDWLHDPYIDTSLRGTPLPAESADLSRGQTGHVAQRQGEDQNKDVSSPSANTAPTANKTGLPDTLKRGGETLSGCSMDDVDVHYNSPQPGSLNAHAYAQGADIHLSPGQELYLPHEAWPVVQQKQGRVQATMQTQGVAVSDDKALEREADEMGAKAARGVQVQLPRVHAAERGGSSSIIQQQAAPGNGNKLPPKKQVKIDSIEDFIHFVEQVEQTYPSATPEQITSEIRQIWFSDINWEIMVDSRGISNSSGGFVDIETKPNPIAVMFDMKDLAPMGREKVLSSPLGSIAISHVVAGIDAHLSGAPSLAKATDHAKQRGRDTGDIQLKHKTLSKGYGKDPADFATWSGDLGQGYAEYLVDRYVKGNTSSTLKTFMDNKAPVSQMLADIHGYIAVAVCSKTSASHTPSGGKLKLSNILRNLYLVRKKGVANQGNLRQIPRTYRAYFEEIIGKKDAQLDSYITKRAISFASLWFAKKAVAHRGWWKSKGFGKEAILNNTMEEFAKVHRMNQSLTSKEDRLDHYIDQFVDMLATEMP